jgi:hypothetical protein
MMAHICPVCLDIKMKSWLGRKVIAVNKKKQIAGVLLGFKVNGRALNVLVQEGKCFYAVEGVSKLSFQDQHREEITLVE